MEFRPPYPLLHSVVESVNVHTFVMEQCHVQRVYPVPWSILLLRCFLKFLRVVPPLVSHPDSGCTPTNVTEWSRLAEEEDGDGCRAWQMATAYLKEEGYLVFACARPVDSYDQWLDEVNDAARDLLNATLECLEELQFWWNSTHYRVVRDMAFHEQQAWLKTWLIKDRPPADSILLSRYKRWLHYREDLDIGYVLAKPGESFCYVTCFLSLKFCSNAVLPIIVCDTFGRFVGVTAFALRVHERATRDCRQYRA